MTGRVIITAGILCLLVSCSAQPSGDTSDALGQVTAVYPYSGHPNVPTGARVLVRFDRAIGLDAVKLVLQHSGGVVETQLTLSPDGTAATLIPSVPLAPLTQHEVLREPNGQVLARFTTEGSRALAGLRPEVSSLDPLDSELGGAFDFSTFHVVFTEPLETAPMVRLVRETTGESVASTVILRGSRLTIDPDLDLTSGEPYTLELAGGRDRNGEELLAYVRRFLPTSSGPRRIMNMHMTPEGASAFDGRPANALVLSSTLVGVESLRMSGPLVAEMPDVTQHPDVLPIVIRKGQLISVATDLAEGLQVKLGGIIDTGLRSGPIQMVLLSDATGYIAESPLAAPGVATRPVARISLDTAMVAEDPTVNALLTQDVLDLRLYGELSAEGDRLAIELVGTTDISLLGAEEAPVWVAVKAWSTEQVSMPREAGALKLVSTIPGEGELARPDMPLTAVFSAPLLDSPSGAWIEPMGGDATEGTADDLPASLRVVGGALVLTPRAPLPDGSHRLHLRGVTGRSGLTLEEHVTVRFVTRPAPEAGSPGPIPTAIRPGLPCAPASSAAEARCTEEEDTPDPAALGPAEPIEIYFQPQIAPESVRLGTSIRILREGGEEPVPGLLEASRDRIAFWPNAPWQPGARYVLQLGTEGACGVGAVCGVGGRALNADVLLDKLEEPGGQPLEVRFAGSHRVAHVLALELSPSADLDGDGQLRGPEQPTFHNSARMQGPKDDPSMTYFSGTLLTEVGAGDSVTGRVPLTVSPGSWMLGTTTTLLGVTTDRLVIRPAKAAQGYLAAPAHDDPDQRTVVRVPMQAYVGSTNATVRQAMQREPVLMSLSGRLGFTADGRLVVELVNDQPVKLRMLQGTTEVIISVGDAKVRAMSLPQRR